MPKSRGRHRGKPSSRGRTSGPARSSRRREPDLLDQAAAALAEAHPLGLLSLASALLNALDPRNNDPFDRSAEADLPPVAGLIDNFVASGEPELAALAWTMAHLADDDLLRTRTVRALSTVMADLPPWLRGLADVEVDGAEQLGDVLRDAADVVVHARLAGHDLMAITLVDFNLGTIVKDSFFSDQTLSVFNELWQQQEQVGMTAIEPLSLADARERLADAVEVGARTWPPEESESWPAGRPLLEWLLRHMPAGGMGFVRPEWSNEEMDRLRERFFASAYAAGLDRPDDPAIVDDLLWYRTGYGYGDPMRWSATALEILMLDWYPRKIVADQAYLDRMPTVLRQFIRFVHADIGLDDALTAETLSALDAFTRDYQNVIGTPRRQGPEALLERLGALDPLPNEDARDHD